MSTKKSAQDRVVLRNGYNLLEAIVVNKIDTHAGTCNNNSHKTKFARYAAGLGCVCVEQ